MHNTETPITLRVSMQGGFATDFPGARTNQHSGLSVCMDETGLTGTYRIELKWGYGLRGQPGGRRDRGVLAVLEAQLGLKLEPRRAPVEMLVIDYINRQPTSN
jgi:uncharacterized protein (TIGR03435 family)